MCSSAMLGTVVTNAKLNIGDAPVSGSTFQVTGSYPFNANGYWCGGCGAFVADGCSHWCAGSGFSLAQPKSSPHKCPVCEGKGRVKFDPENPLARRRGDFQCKPCSGTGIVWG